MQELSVIVATSSALRMDFRDGVSVVFMDRLQLGWVATGESCVLPTGRLVFVNNALPVLGPVPVLPSAAGRRVRIAGIGITAGITRTSR